MAEAAEAAEAAAAGQRLKSARRRRQRRAALAEEQDNPEPDGEQPPNETRLKGNELYSRTSRAGGSFCNLLCRCVIIRGDTKHAALIYSCPITVGADLDRQWKARTRFGDSHLPISETAKGRQQDPGRCARTSASRARDRAASLSDEQVVAIRESISAGPGGLQRVPPRMEPPKREENLLAVFGPRLPRSGRCSHPPPSRRPPLRSPRFQRGPHPSLPRCPLPDNLRDVYGRPRLRSRRRRPPRQGPQPPNRFRPPRRLPRRRRRRRSQPR